jgi:hypothetical protein
MVAGTYKKLAEIEENNLESSITEGKDIKSLNRHAG